MLGPIIVVCLFIYLFFGISPIFSCPYGPGIWTKEQVEAWKPIVFLASTNASTGSKSSQRFFSAFHSTLWDSVVQRSFILERTIHHRDFEPTGAIELLGALDMLDIMTKVSPFVKTVVLEFYSNLTKGMGDPIIQSSIQSSPTTPCLLG